MLDRLVESLSKMKTILEESARSPVTGEWQQQQRPDHSYSSLLLAYPTSAKVGSDISYSSFL